MFCCVVCLWCGDLSLKYDKKKPAHSKQRTCPPEGLQVTEVHRDTALKGTFSSHMMDTDWFSQVFTKYFRWLQLVKKEEEAMCAEGSVA